MRGCDGHPGLSQAVVAYPQLDFRLAIERLADRCRAGGLLLHPERPGFGSPRVHPVGRIVAQPTVVGGGEGNGPIARRGIGVRKRQLVPFHDSPVAEVPAPSRDCPIAFVIAAVVGEVAGEVLAVPVEVGERFMVL